MTPERDYGLRIAACSHWVFDLDGTLTLPVHDFAFIRSELGVPPGTDILDHLAALPDAEARPLHRRLQEIETDLAAVTAAAAGAEELVRLLLENGARCGVLTRNTRQNALHTLELIGLGDCFTPESVVGRAEALPKPDPEGIHLLASRWGADPSSTVMVGDYLFDLQSGRAAGSVTVHVDPTRSFPWPELTDIGVATLEELAGYLRASAE